MGRLNPIPTNPKSAMNKQEAIRNAARAVKAHGLSLPSELDKQIAGLENPQYRVAVVGEYQVGKSTLINRVFLGDKPILSEGDGFCNTAVATDVEYGPNAKMEIFDWTDSHQENEVLVKTVDNPTECDVKDATVATETETRAELAKKRARVRIQAPIEALRGFTVIDTPGLDDPEEEILLNTTWRVIPSADVALLVVDCKRLPESTDDKPVRGKVPGRVMDLLRKKIMGENGIARLMVLVSCKPSDGFQAKQRAKALSDIKAQLANIGRENIPVELYCFDSAVTDIMSDVSEIRLKIRTFLTENALPGREEKVANLVRAEIEKDLVEVAAKLKTVGTSEADRAALVAKVEAEVAHFKEKAELAFERFQADVQALDDDLMHDVDNAVEIVFAKFLDELKAQDSIDGMKRVLDKAEATIKDGLQNRISIIASKLKDEISDLVKQYGKNMEDVRRRWNVFLSDEFQIQKPFVAKIPTTVWTALEIVLLNIILPLGWITAIVAHLCGKSFFNPVAFGAKILIVQQVEKGLEESKLEVRHQIMNQVSMATHSTFDAIKNGMEEFNHAQVEAIRSALAAEPADSGDRAALESAKADLESALAAL